MNPPVQVLLVEDSAYMRHKLKSLLEADSRFRVVGEATEGRKALELVLRLKPDVVTLDIELPGMSGLDVLEEITKTSAVPVIVVSALTTQGAEVTLQALEMGALDFVTKPTAAGIDAFQYELLTKLLAAPRANLHRLRRRFAAAAGGLRCAGNIEEQKLVVMACSIGGPQALHFLLPQLPENFPAPVVVVQHMPPGYTKRMADGLNQSCRLSVDEAKDGGLILPGRVYLAPGGLHLAITNQKRFHLKDDPPINSVRPSADVTLTSAARAYRDSVIAVILTGMGKDGTAGAVEVKRWGGVVVAETESSCVVYGMSKNVIEAGACHHELPLEKICEFLLQQLQCTIA